VDELELIGRTFRGVPLVANMVENGKTPFLSKNLLEKLGFKLIIYPVTILFTATYAIQEGLKQLQENQTSEPLLSKMVSFDQFNDTVKLDEYKEWEKRFSDQ
jgi:methylisocitrate lyase